MANKPFHMGWRPYSFMRRCTEEEDYGLRDRLGLRPTPARLAASGR